MDEIDSLIGDSLISVLRQLRSGYTQRPEYFPQPIILCGVRDVRDYRIHSSSTKEIITGGSAVNIKAESLRLGDFIQPEVESLLVQHTQETGQEFTSEAVNCIWHLSQGQPWQVNALAYETCFRMKEGRDRSLSINKELVEQAKENLISLERTLEEGLSQTWEYMERCGTQEGHLIVFDHREHISWEEKIFCQEKDYSGYVHPEEQANPGRIEWKTGRMANWEGESERLKRRDNAQSYGR